MKTNWPLRAMPQSYHLFTLLSFCWWYSPMTSPSQSHHLRFQQGWNFESEPFWHLVFHGPCLHDTILWTKRILGTFEFVAGMEWDSRRFKVRKLGKICRGGKFCPNGKKRHFESIPNPEVFLQRLPPEDPQSSTCTTCLRGPRWTQQPYRWVDLL